MRLRLVLTLTAATSVGGSAASASSALTWQEFLRNPINASATALRDVTKAGGDPAVDNLRALVASALATRGSHGIVPTTTATHWALLPSTLERYISAGDGDLEAAAAKLVESVQFRVSHRVDNLLQDAAAREEERQMRQVLLYDITDSRNGRSVLVERAGAWDIDKIRALCQEEDGRASLLRSHLTMNEMMGKNSVAIFDMDGFGMGMMGPFISQPMAGLFQVRPRVRRVTPPQHAWRSMAQHGAAW